MRPSSQLCPMLPSPSASVHDPSNTPNGIPTLAPQGPASVIQDILSGGESSQFMGEAACMGDPLLVQNLHAGNGTGTKGAAIWCGPGELLIPLTSIDS